MTGRLILVATPIGNLDDISHRAATALATADMICCEDTRRTSTLLRHLGISGIALRVCNEHTEHDLAPAMVDALAAGQQVVVVSDAGTPAVSDPGQRLVAAAVADGHLVEAVPGANAVLCALVVSGLPTDRFVFEGFLPRRGVERRDRLTDIAGETRTVVLYEAPHRIVRTIDDLRAACGGHREVSISRELTKMHEETRRGTLDTIDVGDPRGEYVIVLGGATRDDTIDAATVRRHLDAELAAGATRRDAAAAVARRLGVPRRMAYDLTIGRDDPQPTPPSDEMT